MKPMTYRTRLRLKRVFTTLGIVLLVAVVAWVSWLAWLGRYIVYDSDGAHLNFDYVSPEGEAVLAVEPEQETVALYYNEGVSAIQTPVVPKELSQISGYYITGEMLTDNMESVQSVLAQIPSGSAVMFDMKNGYGKFYYDSNLSGASTVSAVDGNQVEELIETLADDGHYLIARVSAFRDRAYGLENTSQGLAHTSGEYLWADSEGCYWLDPTKTQVLDWLTSVAAELKAMGFDEVVFTDFRFPDTENILFESSRQEALEASAATLAENCATAKFAVSFETDNTGFALPEGKTRMYLTGVAAENAETTAASVNVADTAVNLVFLAESNDTRFDAYSVLRLLPVVG